MGCAARDPGDATFGVRTSGLDGGVLPACKVAADCAAVDPCFGVFCIEGECRTIAAFAKPDCCSPGGFNSNCDDNDPATPEKCVFSVNAQPGAVGKCNFTKLDAADCDQPIDCPSSPCGPQACINHACYPTWLATKPACCESTAQCDDGQAATKDTCPKPGGTCTHTLIPGLCTDNGDAAVECNDSNPCTFDYCLNGYCRHTKPQPGC